MLKPKETKDLRLDSKIQKKILGALDILESNTNDLAMMWESIPCNIRPEVLAHSPALDRLVTFARRWC
jgi:hypothetical protein